MSLDITLEHKKRRHGGRGGNKQAQKARKKAERAKLREMGPHRPYTEGHKRRGTRGGQKNRQKKEEIATTKKVSATLKLWEEKNIDFEELGDCGMCRFIKEAAYAVRTDSKMAGLTWTPQLINDLRCMLAHWLETQRTKYSSTYDTGMAMTFAISDLAYDSETKTSGFYKSLRQGAENCRWLLDMSSKCLSTLAKSEDSKGDSKGDSKAGIEIKSSRGRLHKWSREDHDTLSVNFPKLTDLERAILYFYMEKGQYLDHEYAVDLPARFAHVGEIRKQFERLQSLGDHIRYLCWRALVSHDTTTEKMLQLPLMMMQRDYRFRRGMERVRKLVATGEPGDLLETICEFANYPLEDRLLVALSDLLRRLDAKETIKQNDPLFKPVTEHEWRSNAFGEIANEVTLRQRIEDQTQARNVDYRGISSQGLHKSDPDYVKVHDAIAELLDGWTTLAAAYSQPRIWFAKFVPEYQRKLEAAEKV